MGENIDIVDSALTDQDMTRIAAIDTRASLFLPTATPTVVSQLGNLRLD